MLKKTTLTLLATCLSVGALAQDSPTVYTYAAHWDVPRAGWQTFTADNGTNALLDRLVADGTLMWWSNIERFVHAPEGITHATMWAATSLSGIERTLEELAKLPAGPAVDGVQHHDHLFVSLMHGGKTANTTDGYMWISIDQTVPMQGARWLEIQRKYYEPVYEQLLADGSLLAYDVSREYVHGSNPRRRFTVLVVPNAEADAKVDEALRAVAQEHADIIFSAFQDTEIRAEHRDQLHHLANYSHK